MRGSCAEVERPSPHCVSSHTHQNFVNKRSPEVHAQEHSIEATVVMTTLTYVVRVACTPSSIDLGAY